MSNFCDENEDLVDFLEDEIQLIRTLAGAKETMTEQQWAMLKTSANQPLDYLPSDIRDQFKGIEKFLGIYTLIEDITGETLEVVIKN